MAYERISDRATRGLKLRLPKIRRFCLKCDAEFMAKGRFNRICPRCTQIQASGDRSRYYNRWLREQRKSL